MAKGTCSIEGCERRVAGWGVCAAHYVHFLRYGRSPEPAEPPKPPEPRLCSIDGCDEVVMARGWCSSHYQRWRKTGDPGTRLVRHRSTMTTPTLCSIEGCDLIARARGWCSTHYARWRNTGDPSAARPIGASRRRSVCSVAGCDQMAYTKGFCFNHYTRFRYHGDPLGGGRPGSVGDDEEQFWALVDASDSDGCWYWIAGTTNGYGMFGVDGTPVYAHRWSYEHFVGPIPVGMVVDHLCHNADLTCPGGKCRHLLCVRPDHLEAVTIQVNVQRGFDRRRLSRELRPESDQRGS